MKQTQRKYPKVRHLVKTYLILSPSIPGGSKRVLDAETALGTFFAHPEGQLYLEESGQTRMLYYGLWDFRAGAYLVKKHNL